MASGLTTKQQQQMQYQQRCESTPLRHNFSMYDGVRISNEAPVLLCTAHPACTSAWMNYFQQLYCCYQTPNLLWAKYTIGAAYCRYCFKLQGASTPATVFNLVNVIMGAGYVSIPFACRSPGFCFLPQHKYREHAVASESHILKTSSRHLHDLQ